MNVDLLIKNAAELLTCHADSPKKGSDLNNPGVIKNGAIAATEGKITFVGPTDQVDFPAKQTIDAAGKVVMPGLIDCHTHAVFGGSRENDFLRKLRGDHYLDILKAGGGILSTVEKTRAASEEELLENTLKHLDKMLAYGTTTLEIKSGYGLNFQDEQKILEVAEMAHQHHPMDVVKTYLGAHTVPKEKSKLDYINEVINSLEQMKPLAEFCDIFCEDGAFTLEDSRFILTTARDMGYKVKIHAEQMSTIGGAELAAELNAVSADHLDYISDEGIDLLAASDTVGVLLPGVVLYLMLERYAPARKMIDRGMALALSTDFNPGSCPCDNLQLIMTLACLQMKMLPAEVINAATINAAFALDRQNKIGSLHPGKQADIIILDAPNHNYIPYRFGANRVETVIKNGCIFKPEK